MSTLLIWMDSVVAKEHDAQQQFLSIYIYIHFYMICSLIL